MQILAFETATDALSCAVNIDGEIIEKFVLAPQRHSDLILSMITELLKEASCSLSDCDAIAFGAGPGSFMGVRIATAVAQGLGYGMDCPLIPISTLQVLAQVAYAQTKQPQVLAGWDAKMAAIYWGIYRVDNQGLMQAVSPDCLTAPENIVLPAPVVAEKWLAAGNAWAVYHNALSEAVTAQFADIRADLHPRAGAMAVLAADYYRRGAMIRAEQAVPVYLRDDVARKSIK